jgi:mycofactocin system glycosyltransferase
MTASRAHKPFVSVVVPIRNGPRAIAECLGSLTDLSYPPDRLEVIVVDDASTDDTRDVVRGYADALRLTLVEVPVRQGQTKGRNLGADRARGEILAFIDGDCTAGPAWLDDLVGAFEEPGVVAVGGAVVPKGPDTWLQRYEEVSHPSYRGRTASRVEPGTSNDYLAGCNVLVLREAFAAAGGFAPDLDLAEDVEIIWRLVARGGAVRYRPDGSVAHEHIVRLGPFLRRRFVYGGAEAVLLRRYPRNGRTITVPFPLLLAAAWVVTMISTGHRWLALAGFVPPAVDSVAVAQSAAGASGVRRALAGHASVLYRALTYSGRYYALPLAALAFALRPVWRAWWLLAAWTGAGVAGPALVEWARRRPRLDPLRFAAAHVLDTIAVHAGILWACLRRATLRPLMIRVSIPPSSTPLLAGGLARETNAATLDRHRAASGRA